MIRALWVALLPAVACGRSQGVPDQELGELVIANAGSSAAIEVAKAARDPVELGRALMMPHHDVLAALGPHTVSITTHTTVEEAGKVTTELGDQTTLEIGEGATFHGLYTNTGDYGREVTFVDGTLYLRPRYQRWHARAPETTAEPGELRDAFFEPIAATWELLAPGVEPSGQGTAEVAGRAGTKIAIKMSPRPARPAEEKLAQRTWREQRTVEDVSGEVILDTAKGVPLAVKLSGTVGFSRDGRRFQMKTSLTATLASIGTPVAITAPSADEIVATPERRREVDERDYLLEGIAPPLRKNPDGTAARPSLPTTSTKRKAP